MAAQNDTPPRRRQRLSCRLALRGGLLFVRVVGEVSTEGVRSVIGSETVNQTHDRYLIGVILKVTT